MGLVAWRNVVSNQRVTHPSTNRTRRRVTTLRRVRLVLGWVTVYGQLNHLTTKPAS